MSSIGAICSYTIKQNTGGPAAARNIGIEKATGQLICLLDSDDLMEKDKITSQVAIFVNNPKTAICHSNALVIDETDRVTKNSHIGMLKAVLIKAVHTSKLVKVFNPININTVMFDKSKITGTFLEDGKYAGVEDWLFWLKNLNPDHKCDFINRPLTRYRVHKHSLSSNLGVEQLKRGFFGYQDILLVKQSSRAWIFVQHVLFRLRLLKAIMATKKLFTKKN